MCFGFSSESADWVNSIEVVRVCVVLKKGVPDPEGAPKNEFFQGGMPGVEGKKNLNYGFQPDSLGFLSPLIEPKSFETANFQGSARRVFLRSSYSK